MDCLVAMNGKVGDEMNRRTKMTLCAGLPFGETHSGLSSVTYDEWCSLLDIAARVRHDTCAGLTRRVCLHRLFIGPRQHQGNIGARIEDDSGDRSGR